MILTIDELKEKSKEIEGRMLQVKRTGDQKHPNVIGRFVRLDRRIMTIISVIDDKPTIVKLLNDKTLIIVINENSI